MKNSFSINIIFVLLIIVGCSLVPFLTIQLTPSKNSQFLTISFTWEDVLPEIIEKEVTSKLEGLASTVSNIKEISSTSSKGKGSILIEFDKDIDLKIAKFELNSLIRSAYQNLPENVTLPLITEGKSRSRSQEVTPILFYSIISKNSLSKIQKTAESIFNSSLSSINGVDEVRFYGAVPYEWELQYDKKKLEIYQLTIKDIETSIREYLKEKELGIGIEKISQHHTRQQFIEYIGHAKDTIIWSSIPIKKIDTRILHLGDILTTASYKEQAKDRYIRVNGLNNANMTIYVKDGVNQIAISKEIRNKIKDLKENLPNGYSLLLTRNTTEELSKEINNIILKIIASIVIIFFFVFLINRNWRYLFIILASLVANISIAFILYYIFAIEIHLYSLAGLTVSFGILVDNSILMLDHIRNKNNKNVFLAIVAATFTTLGALSIIFFLEESIRNNLIDFAFVLVINLLVSLIVSYFFIPSLLHKLPLKKLPTSLLFRRKIKILKFSIYYLKLILFSHRFKKTFVILIVLTFGIPFFLLPASLEGDEKYVSIYNKITGSNYFEELSPHLNKFLGGTFRLFAEADFIQLDEDDQGRTELKLSIEMPDGATLLQTNTVAEKIENFLSQFREIDIYFTNIYNIENARINILFKPEYDYEFPEFLKNELITLSTTIGGCDISVRGVGDGFSNKINDALRSSRISITGYNYETVLRYAREAKENLQKNPRINEVFINTGRRRYGNKIRSEYVMNLNKELIIKNNSSIDEIFQKINLQNQTYNRVAKIISNGIYVPVILQSSTALKTDVWGMKNSFIGNTKLGNIGTINKESVSGEIKKVNQEFKVTIEYDFIGSYQLGEQILSNTVDQLSATLPVGYKASSEKFKRWSPKTESQYGLIIMVILIIYFICAILLESLIQPLVIILLIPISFIGIFLTFYMFEIKFDQGGYASFLLLCGLVVNASLYIINDYNNIKKRLIFNKTKMYLKAYNSKIVPILLTVISTILGLLPFLFADGEDFWFALAAGTIGGLVFSIPILILYLPLFLLWKDSAITKNTL